MKRQPAVDKLIEAIERFASGDLSARTNLLHDETDFGRLAHALDKMFNSLSSRQAGVQEIYEACELIFQANPLGIGIYDPQGHQIRG